MASVTGMDFDRAWKSCYTDQNSVAARRCAGAERGASMPVNMKAVIADTFAQMVRHESLDKITVKALIDACHISR